MSLINVTTKAKQRPLISLSMIVKNEARGIVRTLEQALPGCDCVTILDTGSTDGTQDLAIRTAWEMEKTINLVQNKFENFSQARNLCLDADQENFRPVFQLHLSADEIMHNGASLALRNFASLVMDDPIKDIGCYTIRTNFGGFTFDSPRFIITDRRPRFKNRIHEYLAGPKGPRVPAVEMTHEKLQSDRDWTRWHEDLRMLLEDIRVDPTDARNQFYLGQTYECLKMLEEAIRAYDRRSKMGGWHEELVMSVLRKAGCMWRVGRPWEEIQEQYLIASQMAPDLAEPLMQIGYKWLCDKQYDVAYPFLLLASRIPYPESWIYFIDREAYEWRINWMLAVAAWYVGEKQIGREAIGRAKSRRPDQPQVQECFAWYEPEVTNVLAA